MTWRKDGGVGEEGEKEGGTAFIRCFAGTYTYFFRAPLISRAIVIPTFSM